MTNPLLLLNLLLWVNFSVFGATTESESNTTSFSGTDVKQYVSEKLSLAEELTDSSTELALEQLAVAKKGALLAKDDQLIGDVYFAYGDYHGQVFEFTEALSAYENAQSHYKKINYQKGELDALYKAGVILTQLGFFSQSLSKFQEILRINRLEGDSASVAGTYNNIGNVYKELQEFDMAKRFYLKSLELKHEWEDEARYCQVLSNLGTVCIESEDYDRAELCLRKVITLSENTGELNDIAMAYTHYGVLHSETGDYETAEHYFEKALRIRQDLNDDYGLLHTNINKSTLYVQKGILDKGLDLSLKCRTEARRLKLKDPEKQAVHNLYLICKKNGDFENALNYYIDYTNLIRTIEYERNLAQEQLRQVKASEPRQIAWSNEVVGVNIENKPVEPSHFFWETNGFIVFCFFIILIVLIFIIERNSLTGEQTSKVHFKNINALSSSRILYVSTAILYPVVVFIIPDSLNDPLINRLIISLTITVVYITSYFSHFVRNNIEKFSLMFFSLIVLHHFYLIWLNEISVIHVFFLLIILSGITAVFATFRGILFYSVGIFLVAGTITYFTEEPVITPRIFLTVLGAILLISVVVFLARIDVSKQLNFSNTVVNQADALVFIANRKGENVYVGESVKNILGYLPETFTRHNWLDLLGLDKNGANRIRSNLILIAMGNVEPSKNRYQRLFTKDGEEKWFSFTEKRIEGDHVLIMGIDVTKQKKTEDELVYSERNFRQINETLTDVFFLYNIQGSRYEYISPNCYSVLGTEPDFFYEHKDYASVFVIDEDKEKLREAVVGIEKGKAYEIEYRILVGDKLRWVKEKSYPVKDEYGNIIKSSGICQDITERKKAEEEIQKLSLIASYTDNFVLIVDASNRIEWANSSFYKLTGFSPLETIGRIPLELISGEATDENIVQQLTESIFVNRKQGQYEMINYKKNGEPFFSSIEVTPVWDEDKVLEKYFVIGSDITEKVTIQNEVEQLSLVASNTSNYVIIAHVEKGIEWVNDAFTNKFGHTLSEAKGKFPSELLHNGIAPLELLDTINDKVLKKGLKHRGEVKQYTKDGDEVYSSVDITPLKDREQNIQRYFVLGVDITERKRYEERITEFAGQLEIVHAIDKAILTAESTDEIIYNTLEKTLDTLPISRASLTLFNFEEKSFYSYAQMANGNDSKTDRKVFALSDFASLPVLQEKQSHVVINLSQREEKSKTDEILINEGAQFALLSPLFHDKNLIGSLNVCFSEDRIADEDYIEKVTSEVANGLAIALQQSKLKDQLRRSNSEVMVSIDYAKMIQQAYIPASISQGKYLTNNFIINRPKDLVSGDFYWTGKVNDTIITAVGDCTGHGVPGAFMTIIGISELSKIVLSRRIVDPAEILTELNAAILKALASSNTDVQLTDGMDVGIICYNVKDKTLEYGGARRPLYYAHQGELNRVEGTRLSIGEFNADFRVDFTKTTLPLGPDITYYVFSDGCTDQFGGERWRKFSRKRLEQIMSEMHSWPLEKQKDYVAGALSDWQGDADQTDDILFVGLQID